MIFLAVLPGCLMDALEGRSCPAAIVFTQIHNRRQNPMDQFSVSHLSAVELAKISAGTMGSSTVIVMVESWPWRPWQVLKEENSW